MTSIHSLCWSSSEAKHLVESSPLFRDMPAGEIAAILTHMQPMICAQGTSIVEQGTWDGQFYIVVSGSARVLLQDGEQARTPFSTGWLGPGECFGEVSLLTGESPAATVRAEEDTTVWSLTQADFLALIEAYPTLLRNINRILSLRLARTNRQLLSTKRAERVWLAFVDTPGSLLERSLAMHIAQALAERSRKRVLLLELCSSDQAVGPHFAAHADQVRPGVLACTQNNDLLQKHKAPTVTAKGQHFAALAAFIDGDNVNGHKQAGQTTLWNGHVQATLLDLAAFYDYILFVTTQESPAALVRAVEELCQRAVVLVSANAEALQSARLAVSLSRAPFSESSPVERSLFVAHVPERPTIGAQDRYAAQLGIGAAGTSLATTRLARLLPADSALLEECWRRQEALTPGADLTKAVDFVARHIARQTVGVAFGAGGARGFAHIGVMKHLLEYGIPFDYIAGCSIGIIPAGMYLLDKSFDEMEEAFLRFQRYIVKWRIPRTSIFSNKGVKHLFEELCGTTCFEDLPVPFAVVVIDLATRAGVVLDRGPIWQAGLASVSVPAVFPPVLIGKHALIDGGMHDPVPVSVIKEMGADILIASALRGQNLAHGGATDTLPRTQHNRHKRAPRSAHIVDMLLHSYSIAMTTISMHSIREADVVIQPKLHRVPLYHFSEGHKFVMAGYEAVEDVLPLLQKRLPWLVK